MKKAKIFFGILLILIVLLCGFCTLLSPHSYSDIFDKRFDDITPSKNSSAFEFFNVQEYNNTKYYIDDSCNLCSKKNNKVKIIISNVENFLLLGDELIYTLFDNEKKVYATKIQENRKRTVANVDAKIILNCEKFFYIYSKDNYLYKFEKNWKKVEVTDIKKKGYNGCFERACVINDKIVLYTEESEVYIYDVTEYKLQKVSVPGKSKTFYSIDTDIIQWEGRIYYLLCYYDDGDMHNSLTRTDSAENGIYRLDIENKRFTKVSDDVGDIMIVIKDELYVVSDYFLGISYRVKKVDFV